MNTKEIIIELDEEDIKTLLRGEGIIKETNSPDILSVCITKWDFGQEVENSIAEDENIGDIVFEPEKPIKIKE